MADHLEGGYREYVGSFSFYNELNLTKRRFVMSKMISFLGAAFLFVLPLAVSAQTADTIWVAASPTGNINNFIMGDSTSTGQRNHPNAIYALYQDSIYFYNATMNVNFPLTLVGGQGSGRPPVIAPAILPDGSLPNQFLDVFKGNLTLENLFLLGIGTNNHVAGNGTDMCAITGDSLTVTLDSCIFDGWNWEVIGQIGAWDNFYITNCYFKNLIHPTSWFYGEALRGDGFNVPIDTIIVVNNTFFNLNGNPLCPTGYCNLERFEHNSVIINEDNPLNDFGATNEEFKNNIFYCTETMAATPDEVAGAWLTVLPGLPSGTFAFAPISLLGYTTNVTEAERHIEVLNNLCFQPPALTDFYATWNDTVKSKVFIGTRDSIFTQNGTLDTIVVNDSAVDVLTPSVFMDPLTDSLFSTKSTWPNLVQSGNDTVDDPGFQSFVADQVDSAIEYMYLIRDSQNGFLYPQTNTYLWNYNPGTPVIPSAPLFDFDWPYAESFAYSNTSLQHAGTDGFALGDLNWFPDQKAAWLAAGGLATGVKPAANTTPAKFDLSNNYPNPFNPSTTIKVTLVKNGQMSLKIYNVLGQLVNVVDQGYKTTGEYIYNVSMDRFASGVYFYTLQQGSNMITRKMILLK